MVFTSVTFLFCFLPVLLVVYYVMPSKLRNVVLLLASLLFYLWGGADFIFFLLGVICLHWFAGVVLDVWLVDRVIVGRLVVGGVLLLDVAMLAWFKYSNFCVDQINLAASHFLSHKIIEDWTPVLLPIGISFFTFQAASYVIDVFKQRVRALKNPISFALYVSMFPQLIAGPIVRYSEIENQLEIRRSVKANVFFNGLNRFVHGVVKKVLVADQVSYFADSVFASVSTVSCAEAWLGALSYTIQIYFDFSAYSDMAIGLGMMFGFEFPENFKRPYSAHSITEFWRRWHVTLSRWFRDYLYIPLGGSRVSKFRNYINLMIVFMATAIWHGANWTFLVWGAWHGFWLIVEKQTGKKELLPGFTGRILTLLVIVIGWVFFRAESITDGFSVLIRMFGIQGKCWGYQTIISHMWWQPLCALLLGLCLMLFAGKNSLGAKITDSNNNERNTILLIGINSVLFPIAIMTLVAGTNSPFLYFRF